MSLKDRRKWLGGEIKKAWRMARNDKAAAAQKAREVIAIARDTRTEAQRQADIIVLAAQVNALGCDTFRRAA